jgi:acetyl esterase
MPASVDNAPQNPAPFVDQRPNGPGVSKIDPSDPAAPMYRLLAKMRSPVTLRDLMIHPVRTGYIGQEQPLTAADLPKSAAELYPEIGVSEVAVPSPAGRIRCQVFSPPASKPRTGPRPMMLYLHGGGFTLGQSEDTAYITSRIAAENATVVVRPITVSRRSGRFRPASMIASRYCSGCRRRAPRSAGTGRASRWEVIQRAAILPLRS